MLSRFGGIAVGLGTVGAFLAQQQRRKGESATSPWFLGCLFAEEGPSKVDREYHLGGGRFHKGHFLDPHGISRLGTSTWDDNWDNRGPQQRRPGDPGPDRASQVGKGTRNLLLIRHGHFNLSGETDEERKLTKLGRKQAAETGKRLSQLGFKWTRIIRSNMMRAMETADLIMKELGQASGQETLPVPEDPDPILREGSPIRPEPDVGTWKPENDYFVDGCRVEAAFRKYFHRAEKDQDVETYELMVCHANVIRYFLCRVLQLPPEAWLRITLRHASLTWVVIRPDGRVAVRCIGDAGHMPTELLTTINYPAGASPA